MPWSGPTSACVAMATTPTSSPSRAAGAAKPVKVRLCFLLYNWYLLLYLSFKFILHPSSLKGYSRSSVHGLRRSLTCCRTSCTTTASVLWRNQCWSLSFQWRHTRPPVRTDTLPAITFILDSLTNSSFALSTAPGYSVPTVANGIGRYPSFGDASSRPSSRHPSVGSTRLPSVGEESTHPLLLNDETVHRRTSLKNIG